MENSIFNCLYCGLDKPIGESSLEHAIPQFMGGNYAPTYFKLKNVCGECNNKLGLFVDASYAKSFFISNIFSEVARSLCTSPNDPGLPLRYIGIMKLDDLAIPLGHVAEYWIGTSGETIAWIRLHDERMDSYAGGNPIDAKKKSSVVYFFPVSDNPLVYEVGIKSFQHAFSKRKARKVFCAHVVDAEGKEIPASDFKKLGFHFDVPTTEDLHNWQVISKAIADGNMPARMVINEKFDYRFICKMAMSVGYSLFGNKYLIGQTATEARRGIWRSQDGLTSQIRGTPTLNFDDPVVSSVAGYPSAVALTVMKTRDKWTLILSIDERIPFVVELGDSSMTSSLVSDEEGYTLLLFPYLDKSIETTTAALLAHRLGNLIHPELAKIDEVRKLAAEFNAKLVI